MILVGFSKSGSLITLMALFLCLVQSQMLFQLLLNSNGDIPESDYLVSGAKGPMTDFPGPLICGCHVHWLSHSRGIDRNCLQSIKLVGV